MTHNPSQPHIRPPAGPVAKPYRGMAMEGMIAAWYTKVTARDLAEFERLARRVAAELPPPESGGVACATFYQPRPGWFPNTIANDASSEPPRLRPFKALTYLTHPPRLSVVS